MTEWKLESLDLMKVLSDPRRMQILTLAEQPITVKDLAELMGEKPSRLYYHVNKLQEVGLLKVVDQKQMGNLVENYYQSDAKSLVKGNIMLQAENLPMTVANWQRALLPSLRLYEKSLEKVKQQMEDGETDIERYPYHLSMNRSTIRMTAKEWQDLNLSLLNRIIQAEGEEEAFPQEFRTKMTPEEEKEMGTYQFLLISYRMEDANKLGLIEDDEEE